MCFGGDDSPSQQEVIDKAKVEDPSAWVRSTKTDADGNVTALDNHALPDENGRYPKDPGYTGDTSRFNGPIQI